MKFILSIICIAFLQIISAQQRLDIQGYPTDSKKYERNTKDYAQVTSLIENGEYQSAYDELKRLEKKAIKVVAPADYYYILNQTKKLIFGIDNNAKDNLFYTWSNQFDEEIQEMVWEDAQKVENLTFPLNAILHSNIADRIELLNLNQLLTYDDESLIWKINNESKKLKNGNFKELVNYHTLKSIENPSRLMAISSDNFKDSSNEEFSEALQQYRTLFELLADNLFNNDTDENYGNTDLNCFGKTDDLLKINDFYSKENFNYQLYYHIEKLHFQNKRWDAYAFWVAKRLNEAFHSNEKYSKELMSAYQYFKRELENEPSSTLFTLLYCQKLCEKAGQYDWQSNTEVKTYFLDALSLINTSIKKFPNLIKDSITTNPAQKYANQLLVLKEYIENGKSLTTRIKGETILNKPFILNVKSKNTPSVFLKVYHYDKIKPGFQNEGTHFSKYEFSEVYSKELKLYVDSFHQEHIKDFLIPSFSKSSDYLFIIAPTETPIDSLKSNTFKSYVNYFTHHFSNIVVNTKTEGKEFQLLVTNNLTGKPIENAKVTIRPAYHPDPIYGTEWIENKKILKTNKLGLVTFKLESSSYQYTVQKDDDSLTKTFYYSNTDFKLANRAVNTIYTDRGIYRPGQKVYVKVLGFNQNKGADSLETQGRLGVALKDGNGKIIWSDYNLRINEYGSAETSFVLPRDGFLLGECSITVDNGYGYGEKYHSIRIEEYKRPTFEVKFDEIQGNIKLGETLYLTGKATAFSGFPIGNASVRINIDQRNYFPRGCFVQYHDQNYFFETIVKTNENGEFQLDFIPQTKKQSYGTSFSIDAIVTDITGESQSISRYLYVGNKSYSISATIDQNLIASEENSIPLKVVNSENQEVKTAKINYRLIKKNKTKWYFFQIDKAEFSDVNKVEFEKAFPYTRYFETEIAKNETLITQGEINSGADLNLNQLLLNKAGNYSLILSTTDEIGQKTEQSYDFNWINLATKKEQHKAEIWTISSTKSAKVGEEIVITIGSSFKKQPIFLELANEENILLQKWTILKNRHTIKHTVTSEDLHGLTFICMMSKNGESYMETIFIDVPDHSKELNLKLETVRDYLKPGEKEKWNILINNDKGTEQKAELLVGMYDASLDKFQANNWENEFYVRYHKQESWYLNDNYYPASSNYMWAPNSYYNPYQLQFLIQPNYRRIGQGRHPEVMYSKVATKMADSNDESFSLDETEDYVELKIVEDTSSSSTNTTPSSPRRNFDETAFFYPSVYADPKGNYRFEFTAPDALTKWRFMAMAHTKDFKSGYYEHSFEAKKELMIEPNEPRFLREGDRFVFSSKVVNLSDKEQDITTRLKLFDPLTNEVISSDFGDFKDQKVIVKSNGSTEVSWELTIPTNLYSLIAYEISASNEKFSDVERKAIPILSNRMLITTSKSFTKTKVGEETFTLDKINQLSATAEKVAISLEMHTQPVWTILMSLPYLMEYPYECSEQTFSRYYANTTALAILNSHPEFQAIIESWKTTDPSAFLSELEKNPDLKSIILSETPWVMDAQNETAQRTKLAFLFDKNNLLANIENAKQKLIDLQTADGGWAWYGGKEANIYITQYIVSGLRELQDRGELQDVTSNPNLKSIRTALEDADNYLERYYKRLYDNLKPEEIKNHVGLSALHIQWLYSKGGYEFDKNVTNYYEACLMHNWTKFNLQTQAIAGLYALKAGNSELATKIKKSLLQRAINKPDLGMYWNENKAGYYWNEAPIETQAYLIQFFGNFPELQKEVRQMQLWLMQQKRTNSWESTRATTLACMSLFINSGIKTNQLQQVVKVKFADGTNLGTLKKESASNFKFTGKEATNGKSTVTVETQTESPVFGSIYLQFTDLIDKVEKSTADIRLERHFYTSNKGLEEEILPSSILPIGTIVKVKLKVVSNQSMEFVHLKDGKGSGFEAREALSAYHYNSIGYYQVNKDASTEIFIDYLPKGTHQFEYEIIASGKGTISVGAAEVECMYAPSFRANSGGFKFLVK